MADHPINDIMSTAMQNIKEMVDVNTIVGNPVQSPDGSVIIPISKVCFGLATGGGEYGGSVDFAQTTPGNKPLDEKFIVPVKYPFAGGNGAGVSITPIAFIVAGNGNVQLIPISNSTAMEKLVDLLPDFINKLYTLVSDKMKQCASEEPTV